MGVPLCIPVQLGLRRTNGGSARRVAPHWGELAAAPLPAPAGMLPFAGVHKSINCVIKKGTALRVRMRRIFFITLTVQGERKKRKRLVTLFITIELFV